MQSRIALMRLPRLRNLGHACEVPLNDGSVRFESRFDVRTFDEVFLDGIYETDYRDALVIDIGAHKGYYTAFALLRGAARVEAFEPAPENVASLLAVARSLGRCTVHEAAVGSRDEEATLNVSAESWGHSLMPIDSTTSVRVRMLSLANVLADLGTQTRVIMKIDAEGAECEIALRTPPEAWSEVDEVFIEFHRFAPCTEDQLRAHLALADLVRPVQRGGGVLHFRREPSARLG